RHPNFVFTASVTHGDVRLPGVSELSSDMRDRAERCKGRRDQADARWVAWPKGAANHEGIIMTAQPSQPAATNPPREGPPSGIPSDQPARPWRTEGLPKGQPPKSRRR